MSALPRAERRAIQVDSLAISMLGVLLLAPLWTTFQGAAWLVVGVPAVLATVALTAQFRVSKGPVWALPFVAIAAYFLAAAPFVSRNVGFARLFPDGRSFTAVPRATGTQWARLIETLPKVDATGPVLIVPLALAVFPVLAAAILALFTRTTAWPCVPLLLGLAASLGMGRGEPWLVGLGLAYAIVILIWTSDRGARTERASVFSTLTFFARILVALAAGASGASLATYVIAEQQPALLRESVAVGMDPRTMPTLLEGFRRYTRQTPDKVDNVYDVPLLKLSDGSQGLRMRFASLDWYDGTGWRPNPDTAPRASNDRYLKMNHMLDNPSVGREVMVQVEVADGYRGNWIPVAGQLQELGFYTTFDPVYYNVATATAVLKRWVKPGESYYFVSKLPSDRLQPSMTAAQGVDPDLYARASFVAPLASTYLRANATPMRAFFDAAKTLKRKGAYSDGAFGWETRFLPGHNVERLGQLFLDAPQVVGNDEQYAAALALLAIRMNIPARVVVGAVVPPGLVVKGIDVRAWVEVQLADGSWRTLPTEKFLGTKKPERTDPPKKKHRGTLMPSKQQIERQQQIRKQEQITKEQQPEKIKVDLNERHTPWWLLGLVPVVLLLAVPLAKTIRRLRRKTSRDLPSRYARGWQELVDTGRDLGSDIHRTHSRPRQADALGRGSALATIADDRTFGGAPGDPDEADAFWAQVGALQRELRAERSWWARLLATLNPSSFWRR